MGHGKPPKLADATANFWIFADFRRKLENSMESIDQQTMSVQQTSFAIQEMIGSFNRVADTAKAAESQFQELSVSVVRGNDGIQDSLRSSAEIHEASSQVADILKIIEDLAEQSNTLALNAAIESAHAGEFGKGFAIVASEIRKLSENTTRSIQDIEKIIGDMQEKNRRGQDITAKLQDIFNVLNDELRKTGDKVLDITRSAMEQTERANTNLQKIQSMLSLNQELQRSTSGLRDQSMGLNSSMTGLGEMSEKAGALRENIRKAVETLQTQLENVEHEFQRSFGFIQKLEEEIQRYKFE